MCSVFPPTEDYGLNANVPCALFGGRGFALGNLRVTILQHDMFGAGKPCKCKVCERARRDAETAQLRLGVVIGILLASVVWAVVMGLCMAKVSTTAAQRAGASPAPPASARAPQPAPLELLDDPQFWAEKKLQAAALREELYQRNIADFGGSSPFMGWSLRFLQHKMVHQDGPRRGRFIPPSAAHHDLLALIDRKLAPEAVFPTIAGMLARDFAKTTYGTTGLALYAALECGKLNIAIIGKDKGEAKDRIQSIIEELETNERLKAEYGEAIRPAKDAKNQTVGYTDYQIKLKGPINPRTGLREQITIKAYEFGKGGIRGRNVGSRRLDLIILDDPEHDDLAYSELLREKYWRWFKRAVLSSISENGLIVWLGTPIGESSLLMRARSKQSDANPEGMGWPGPLQPVADLAIKPDGEVVEIARLLREEPDSARGIVIELLKHREGVRFIPHWHERFSEQNINCPPDPETGEERSRIGRLGIEGSAQELFLLPASLASNPWDLQWFRRSTYDSRDISMPGPGRFEYQGQPLSRPIIRIDSAGSTESSADFTAIGVFALLPGGARALLLDFLYEQLTVPDQLDKLADFQRLYHAAAIYHQKSHFETTAAQFNAVDKSRLWLPMTPVVMNNSAGAKDRLIRETCSPIRNGAVLFCFDGSRGPQERIVQEAKVFPGGKDDALDMLGNAVKDLFDPERTPGGGDEKPATSGVKRESAKLGGRW